MEADTSKIVGVVVGNSDIEVDPGSAHFEYLSVSDTGAPDLWRIQVLSFTSPTFRDQTFAIPTQHILSLRFAF